MTVAETARLRLRRLTLDDAAFVFELANDPDWIRYIGDRGIRDLDGARSYLTKGPLDMYARLGFGLYAVELKADGAAIGICGLIKRESLPDVDIGFAFLARYRGRGYAREAAEATLAQGQQAYGLRRILAIVSPDNDRSIRLLEGLGFACEGPVKLAGDGKKTSLYVHQS
ncbi:MAG TPA: GNAT family N-acetyltransferase [Gammaproteobacteria bacterium]|nr:GNAT family N-acetyltransferase [Gammaproteobacteria bacterium]